MRRLSIAVIACWYPSTVNPVAGIFNATDARAIAAEHDVHLFHLVAPELDDGARRLTVDGYRVTRIPMSPWNPLHVLRAARTLRPRLQDVDVIHTMAFPSLLPMWLLPRRRPVLHTEHWTGITRMGRGGSRPGVAQIAGMVLRRADRVTAVSTYLAEAITALSGRRTAVVPNIVEIPEEVVASARAHTTSAGETLRIISVGSLSPTKDPRLALETIALLRERGLPVSFAWVGDGPLRESVRADAEELGLTDVVTFHGARDHTEALTLMAGADVILHTSSEETFSLVAAEALGLGKPLVIAERGGHRDFTAVPWVAHVGERTARRYAEGVERALEAWDPEAAAAVGEALLGRFGAEAHAALVTEHYQELIA